MATTKPSTTPSTMKAWQFSSTKGGMPKNLVFNIAAKVPVPSSKQVLVKVKSVALNPVDFKPAELALLHYLLFPKPATPGSDVVGTVTRANGGFTEGQVVLGYSKTPLYGGMLADFALIEVDSVIPLADGVSLNEAAGLPITSLTAYQSIYGRIKSGGRIFVNGGSGGVGTFAIQIAKVLGHSVTATCSSRNVELCKSLGAEVIDYTKGPVLEALKTASTSGKFDLIIDNVFNDSSLYWKAHEYTNPGAVFALTGFSPTPSVTLEFLKMKTLPAFLGGGRRKLDLIVCESKMDQLTQLVDWVAEKKIRVVFDQVYPYDRVPDAYEKLKTGRAAGKIVVEIDKS